MDRTIAPEVDPHCFGSEEVYLGLGSATWPLRLIGMSRLFATARYVDRIQRGARRNELPVQFATKFDLVINLQAAERARPQRAKSPAGGCRTEGVRLQGAAEGADFAYEGGMDSRERRARCGRVAKRLPRAALASLRLSVTLW